MKRQDCVKETAATQHHRMVELGVEVQIRWSVLKVRVQFTFVLITCGSADHDTMMVTWW